MVNKKDSVVSLSNVSRYLKDKLKINLHKDPYQQKYVKSLIDSTEKTQAIFLDAPAGTGKTSLAISVAYYLLEKKQIDQIVYVRNAVSIRDMGFLPGDIAEKEAPYLQSGLDALGKLDPMNKKLIETLMENNKLIVTSTAFLRGADWDGRKFLIIDEAQNLDLNEMQTVLTRPHDETKIVVIGSSLQCDTKLTEKRNPKVEDKPKLLAFQLYAEHFTKYTDLNVESLELKNNYRGKFSQYADKINETIKYLGNPDADIESHQLSLAPSDLEDEKAAKLWEELAGAINK